MNSAQFRILRVVRAELSGGCARLAVILSDILSVGYDNIEGLASSRGSAVGAGSCIPRELEKLVIGSITDTVNCHRKAMSSIDFLVEDLGPIENSLGLTIGEMSP